MQLGCGRPRSHGPELARRVANVAMRRVASAALRVAGAPRAATRRTNVRRAGFAGSFSHLVSASSRCGTCGVHTSCHGAPAAAPVSPSRAVAAIRCTPVTRAAGNKAGGGVAVGMDRSRTDITRTLWERRKAASRRKVGTEPPRVVVKTPADSVETVPIPFKSDPLLRAQCAWDACVSRGLRLAPGPYGSWGAHTELMSVCCCDVQMSTSTST